MQEQQSEDNTSVQQPVQQPTIDMYNMTVMKFDAVSNSIRLFVEDISNYFNYAVYSMEHNNSALVNALQSDYEITLTRDIERINASLAEMERVLMLVYGVPMEVINAITVCIQKIRDDITVIGRDLKIDLSLSVEKSLVFVRSVSILQKDLDDLSSAMDELKRASGSQSSAVPNQIA
jgi:hypothetical protein